jgi:hypothetical protein
MPWEEAVIWLGAKGYFTDSLFKSPPSQLLNDVKSMTYSGQTFFFPDSCDYEGVA